MGLYEHRAVNHLNVLHIISWCLLSLGAEPRWDECHYSGEAPGCDAPFVCRGNEAWLCRDGASSLNCYRHCSPDLTVISCFCHSAKCTAFYRRWAGQRGLPPHAVSFTGKLIRTRSLSNRGHFVSVCPGNSRKSLPGREEKLFTLPWNSLQEMAILLVIK